MRLTILSAVRSNGSCKYMYGYCFARFPPVYLRGRANDGRLCAPASAARTGAWVLGGFLVAVVAVEEAHQVTRRIRVYLTFERKSFFCSFRP